MKNSALPWTILDAGVAQQVNKSFEYNGESDLDLEYAMVLTDPTPITLLQTGDLVEGSGVRNCHESLFFKCATEL
jgi:hypothetical protein